ncbi:MAG TPA: VTT domain-containing protein [Anaerolineae bacterium]|nr:VTT domain-containing protein [Anaerolineae bacterium]
MTSVPEAVSEEKQPFWKSKPFRLLVVALVVGLSVSIFLLRDQFARLASIGYVGILLVSLLGNATIILPAPSLALVFAMGSALPPILVGLAAGVGESLGELTGYAAGYGGRAVIENQATYEKLVGWMQRRGGITILVLSVIPNPFFDVAGIAAGTLRYPLWRFLLFCWLGKTIKTLIVAHAGAYSLNIVQPFLN